MITAYNITFRWLNTNTFCSNIVLAREKEDIPKHYAKHEVISISEASQYDLEEAKRKGKPIVNIDLGGME